MTSLHDDDVLSLSLDSTLSSTLGSDELEISQAQLWSSSQNSGNLSPEVPSPIKANQGKSQCHRNKKRRATSDDSLPDKRRRKKEDSRKAGPSKNHEKIPSRKKISVDDTDGEVAERSASDVLERSTTRPKGGKQRSKAKSHPQVKDEAEEEELDTPKKSRRKRKTKGEPATKAMPIAARTFGLKMYIGAHVSSAKGVHNSVTNSAYIGGNAFALFLKSQRKWQNPALNPDHASLFKKSCSEHEYDSARHVLPHGSYLVNLAQMEPDRAEQAYECFVDDLRRCEALGIQLYNFHPGSTGTQPRKDGIARIASALNRAHEETKSVTTVLETMAGQGTVIGSTFEDLRDIIAGVDDKRRVGVCLDTCHVFAAGYDLRTETAFRNTLKCFDQIIGLKFLSALHLNDSKAPFASHRDLHQNIGLGFLGLRAFHSIMNEPRLEGLPMVLETPTERDGREDKGIWAEEIKLLESLIGLDPSSPEFLNKEKTLADQSALERKKHQETFDKKLEKERLAAERQSRKAQGKRPGRRKKQETNGESI